MSAKGSNDLNLLLKAKVVKLKIELDYKGSKIPTQIIAINKYLENKPVKLKVKFDYTSRELNTQINLLKAKLPKTPIKLKVEIDVKGSADAIKKQLKEVTDVVSAFNAQYGKQIQKMQHQQQQANKTMSQSMKAPKIDNSGNVPTGSANVGGFNNIKEYAKQMKQAEQMMKSKFGKEGIFSSHEIKDAKGNLTGFITKLQSAKGVIESVRYSWNKDKGAFQVIDRATVTNTEKMVKQSIQSLEALQRELGKTGKESNNLTKEYNELMKAGKNGTLTSDMVKGFDVKLKNVQASIQATKAENDLLREQQKLMAEISRSRKGMKNKTSVGELTNLKTELRNMKNSDFKDPLTKNYLNDMRKQFTDVKQGYADQVKKEKELATATSRRLQILSDIKTLQRTTHANQGSLGASNLESIKTDAKAIRTMEDYIAVKKRVDAVNREKKQQKITNNIAIELDRAKKAILDYTLAVGKSANTAEKRFEMLKRSAGTNLAQLTAETHKFKKQLAEVETTRKLAQQANSVVGGANHGQIKKLVDSRDINALKEYIGGINGARVATLSLITDSKGVSKISAQLESTGKTAKKLAYEINDVDKKLRHMGTADVFNRNANLGIFEQLRIAMARVPVWMVAMTAFYGSINVVKDMATQILNLDKALTEIKRVASDNINIDTMFEGAVAMSKELGNNIHDILASVGELARTFGDFNETQLIAITRTATLMSNVSDLNAEEATSSLVGTMNAFNIEAEESIRIVDSLNEVDNNYAISTKQLATGLQKSASTAKTFGVTMEETVGHITSIGAVTMESGNIIGNSLKTIYSRITTLGKSEEVLNSIGVDLKTIGKNGEEDVRPVNDILGDLALRWTDLSNSQRQNIAVQVAGRYQLSRFLALMNNYDMALEATDTAVTSQGSAMRENAEYMKSFEARINQLKNGWVELSSAVGDAVLSSAMMEIIRLLTALAQGAVVFVDKFGALPAILGVLGAIALKMGVFRKVVDSMTTGVTAMQVAYVNAGKGATRFGTASVKSSAVAGAGFGMLRTRATVAMGAIKTSMNTALVAVRTFSIGFQSILASTGIGLIFVAIGFAIEKLMKIYNEKKQKEEEMIKLNDKLVTSYRSHRDGMDSLISKYGELDKKTNRTAEEEREYLLVQKQLAEQLPTTVRYIDSNGKAHLKSTEEIKREVKAVKELSIAQAELVNAKFQENMEKKSKSYIKIIGNIDDLKKKQDELQASDGKHWALKSGQDDVKGWKVDNGVNIQQNKVEVLMAEAEKTDAIQKTMKAVQAQVRSHFEAGNKMGTLGDQQNAMIENFITYNEEMLRGADTPEKFEKAYRDLFEIGVEVGDVFSKAFDKMSKSMKDDPLALADLKKGLGEVAKSVPKTFYEMTDEFGKPTKSIKQITDGLEEIVNVSNRVDQGDGNWKGLVKRLQDAGMSADEAKGYLANLAREHDNAKLRAEAQSQGIDAVSESLDELAEKAMEAIDLQQVLFGFNGAELEGIKSHIQAMHLLADAQGEAGKASEEYKASQEAVTDYLNITNEELEKNKDKYYNIIEALGKLNLSEYDPSTSWEDFINASEIDKDMKAVLLSWDGTKNILTGQKEEIVNSNSDIKKSVGEIKDVFEEDVKSNSVVKAVQDTKKEAKDTSWTVGLTSSLKDAREWFYSFIPKSFSDDVNGMKETVKGFFEGMGDDSKEGMDGFTSGIGKSLSELPSKAGAKMDEWGNSIKSWFTGFGEGASTNMDSWGNSITNWFTTLPEKTKPKLEEWYTSIKEWFTTLPENTSANLEQWWTSISEWFDTIPERMTLKLVGWGIAFTEFIKSQNEENKRQYGAWGTSIEEWFDTIPERITAKLETWKTSISEWFGSSTTFWGDKFSGWDESFNKWFDDVPERITAKLDGWKTAISEWFGSKTSTLGENLGGWDASFNEWFSGLGGRSRTGLDTWWTSIKQWITDTKEKWSTGLDEWWTSIGEWFKTLGDKNEVKASGKDIVGKVGQGIKDNEKDILEKISEIILQIPKYVMIVAGVMLLGLGREIIQAIQKGLTETLPELNKKWDDLKADAIRKLGELATDAYGKGKDFLSNMKKGMDDKSSEWDKSWDSLMEKAKQKLKNLKEDVVSIAKSIPTAMGDAISGAVKGVEKGIKSLSNTIASNIESGLNNTVVLGVNTVLDYMEVPKGKQLSKFKLPRYAKGTKNGNHAGGHAIVGEEGRELAHIPNKGMTVVGQQGSEIIDLPKGSSVLPNKQTEIMLKDYGFPAYATGIGDFFSGLMDKPKKLMAKMFEGLPFANGFDGVIGDLIGSGIGKVKDHAGDFVGGFIKSFFDDGVMGGVSGFSHFAKTSGFGMRKHPITGEMKLHAGQDFAGANNAPIHANVNGKVVASGDSGTTFGNWVKVRNGQFEYIYAHLNSAIAKVGSLIKKGQLLGLMGSTGGSTGTHLHYEVRKNGKAINPNGGGGHSFNGAGSAGALSGDGGSASTGGDSGSSGVMQVSTPSPLSLMGITNTLGDFEFHALATSTTARRTTSTSSSSKKKPVVKKIDPREGIADIVIFDALERSANAYANAISLLEARMARMSKTSSYYRTSVQTLLAYENKLQATNVKSLKTAEARQIAIQKYLKTMPSASKQTTKERETYNRLQTEYNDNLSKIGTIKVAIENTVTSLRDKSIEIFNSFISVILDRAEKAITRIKDTLDNIDFKQSVLELTDPENTKEQGRLFSRKIEELKKERVELAREKSSLEIKLREAVAKYGSDSDTAKSIRDTLRGVEDAWEDATLAILQTEKAIRDMRAEHADKAIDGLKDYYGKMKDLALDAKEAEKKALEESHKNKMDLYDKEIAKINDVYDASINKLDKEVEAETYKDELGNKNADKIDLMNKIALLSNDDSLEGRKRRAELEQELKDKQKEIDDFMKDNQLKVLKEQLAIEKENQLAIIELEKEKETAIFDGLITRLDEEKTAISTHYDNIINDETRWAKVRDDAMKGNFASLETELALMQTSMTDKNSAIFTSLAKDYADYMASIKQETKDIVSSVGDTKTDTSYEDANHAPAPPKQGRLKTGTFGKKSTADEMNKIMKDGHASSSSKVVADGKMWRVISDFESVSKAQKVLDYEKKKGRLANGYVSSFETGGYTGEWGKTPKVALLHEKEIVLKKNDTRNLLDTFKLLDKVSDIMPIFSRNILANDLATGAMNITNNYELHVNIERLNGDKQGANTVVREIMKGLKKMGG